MDFKCFRWGLVSKTFFLYRNNWEFLIYFLKKVVCATLIQCKQSTYIFLLGSSSISFSFRFRIRKNKRIVISLAGKCRLIVQVSVF